MNDLTVLHLSDLHIDDTGIKRSLLLKNLLKDIESEMQYSDNIIIVVTGDLVNRANYKNQNEIIEFFEKLKKILGTRVKHIYIVPGNHDKVRSDLDKMVLEGLDYMGEEFEDERMWRYIRVAFEEHRALVRDIYRKFYSSEKELAKRIFEDTYGVHIDEINGKNICIIQFNTAWTCEGDSDQRNLSIGKYQLQQIRKAYTEKYNKLKEKKIDLTIAVAHHPLNWLTGKEEDLIQEEILSPTGLNVNTYICGHTHNRDVINWHNNRRSMITLVSGLGWPDGSTQHPYAHTYSSYVFNLDVNSVDVYVRSSDDAYAFAPDFRIYTNKADKRNKKIVMPIDTCKTQAYFNLNAVQGRSFKACYITEDVMSEMNSLIKAFVQSEDILRDHLEHIKSNFQSMGDSHQNSGEQQATELAAEKLWEIGEKPGNPIQWTKKQKEAIFHAFSGYLYTICKYFQINLNKLKEGGCIRTHFRHWGMDKNDEYFENTIYGNPLENYTMDPLKWGQLLEKAYVSKGSLIASVNSIYCQDSMKINKEKKEKSQKWTDFITVIPKFDGNVYIKANETTGEIYEERPFLTFGVTVYREEDRDILYLLDYLKIDEFIGRQIAKFLYYFPISIGDYISSLLEGREDHKCQN